LIIELKGDSDGAAPLFAHDDLFFPPLSVIGINGRQLVIMTSRLSITGASNLGEVGAKRAGRAKKAKKRFLLFSPVLPFLLLFRLFR